MPRLNIDHLSYSKDDGTPLFRDICCSVESGEVLVLTGPSGVGKSTLLRCIAQLDHAKDGTVTLDDRTPDELGVPHWRSRVAYVPQRPAPLPGTPIEFYERVCSFGTQKQRLRAIREARAAAAASLPLTASSASTANSNNGEEPDYLLDPVDIGLQWNLNESVWRTEWTRLSGGESQRAVLAIALSLEPDIILLDEPTSALDPEACLLVEKTLLERASGYIWVTHDPAQAQRVASRIMTLRRVAPGSTGGESYTITSAGKRYGTFSSSLAPVLSEKQREPVVEVSLDIPASEQTLHSYSAKGTAA